MNPPRWLVTIVPSLKGLGSISHLTAGLRPRLKQISPLRGFDKSPTLPGANPQPLLFHGNSQRLHLAIHVAAFQAQHLGCPADAAMVLFQLLQDVVAFVGGARLVQAGEIAHGAAATLAVN